MKSNILPIALAGAAVVAGAYFLVGRQTKTPSAPPAAISTQGSTQNPEASPATPPPAEKKTAPDAKTALAPHGHPAKKAAARNIPTETPSITSNTSNHPTDFASGRSNSLSYAAGPTGSASGFGGVFTVGQLAAWSADTRGFTELAAELDYSFGKNHFLLIQEARKLYLVAQQGENEVLVADTVLAHEYELSPDILSFQVKSQLGATVPVSSRSHDVKNISRPSVGVIASREFFNGKLSIEYAPTFQYFLNQYATDPNGVPLRQMAIAQQAEVGVNFFNRRLRWGNWVKYLHTMYQEFDQSKSTPSPTDTVEYGTYLDWRFSKAIAAQVGVLRGSSFLRTALVDAPFYDEHTGRAYGAVTISF